MVGGGERWKERKRNKWLFLLRSAIDLSWGLLKRWLFVAFASYVAWNICIVLGVMLSGKTNKQTNQNPMHNKK